MCLSIISLLTRNIFFRYFTLLNFFLLLSACTSNPRLEPPPPTNYDLDAFRSYLTELIRHEANKHNITGISVGITIGDEFIYLNQFGYADSASKQLLTPSSKFRVASVAKLINAIAVLRLHEVGKLSLDAPIQNYLPHFNISQSEKSPITLRNLLSHQAGLPSDFIAGMWDYEVTSYLTTLNHLETTHFPDIPSDSYLYSNLAFNVVAAVIASVTENNYIDYANSLMHELGMVNSTFTSSTDDPSLALGYREKRLFSMLEIRDVPAAGLVSTVADLLMLQKMIIQRDKRLFESDTSFTELTRNQIRSSQYTFNQHVGLGTFRFNDVFHSSIPVFGHAGASLYHRSLIKWSEDKKLGVVVLSNDSSSAAVIHKLANEALREAYKYKFRKPAPRPHVYWPKAQTSDSTDTESIVGDYATSLGYVKVYEKGKQLKAKFLGRRFTLAKRAEDSLLYLSYKLWGIFPIELGQLGLMGISSRSINGDHYLLSTNTLGDIRIIGRKINENKVSEPWKSRVGRYKAVNALAAVELSSGGIKYNGKFLIAFGKIDKHRLEIVLEPVDDTSAIVSGVGRGFNERVYVIKQQGKEYLSYSGILFEKLE